MKIIRVEMEGLKCFRDGKFKVDFVATDKVFKNSTTFKIADNVAVQTVIGFVGLNATGKTTALRLLDTALNIVIRNEDLNRAILSGLIIDDTLIRTTFFFNGAYHQLESIVGCRQEDIGEGELKFYYKAETLKTKKKPRISSRSALFDFTDEKNVNTVSRASIAEDKAQYLDDSKSIVGPLIRRNKSYVSANFWMNYINAAVLTGSTPREILEVFDDSIEELSATKSLTKNEQSWTIKFKGEQTDYHGTDLLEPNSLISTGTISGQRLIKDAITALEKGGYLIVDELEAHMNKELVRVVLELFSSRETNPFGACLIFSTHYAEILDFSILNRKDNIYIARRNDGLLSVRKLSDDFKRNDFKKSEIFLSNALTGTAPSYEAIENLRSYVCKRVN